MLLGLTRFHSSWPFHRRNYDKADDSQRPQTAQVEGFEELQLRAPVVSPNKTRGRKSTLRVGDVMALQKQARVRAGPQVRRKSTLAAAKKQVKARPCSRQGVPRLFPSSGSRKPDPHA